MPDFDGGPAPGQPQRLVEISDNQGHLAVDAEALAGLASRVLEREGVRRASISIALVDDPTIRVINRRHLGHDWPTDVISFRYSDPDDAGLVGELVVSGEMAASTANDAGADPWAELALYVIHGLLHLCGYDDRSAPDVDAIRRREAEILAAEGLTNTFALVAPSEARGAGTGVATVLRLNLVWMLGLGLPILALHIVSVTLSKALRTYSRSRLEELCAGRGHPERADAIAHQDERTERSAEVLGVVTGLALAALLGATTDRMAPHLAFEAVIAIALAVGAMGYLLAGVVGRVFAEPFLDAFWPAAGLLRALTYPLTIGVNVVEALASRIVQPADTTPRPASVEVEIPSDGVHSPEDVEAELPDSTRELLQRAVELTRRDVSELMTPRSGIVMLPASVSARCAAKAFRESGLSRIPLFGESRDDIIGILFAKDLFPRMTDDGPDAIVPRKLARPAYCVPETKNAFDLLEEFRSMRTQLAIVLDEYGGVSGLVTLEDLIEELVGAIDDEHDTPTPDDPVVPLGGSRYEVDAATPIELLNERLHLRLPTDGDFSTVGGLAFHALGRLPEPGASFRFEGIEFSIVQVVDHSIRLVQVDLQPTAAVGG